MPTKKSTSSKKTATSKKKKSAKKRETVLLTKEIKVLKESLTNIENRHLRLKAEFDNYRKRKDREIIRVLEYRGENIIKLFLPVIDDLERMLDSVNGNPEYSGENVVSIADGITMILEKLLKNLREVGVKPFDSIGSQFDPDLHDALMMQPSEKHGEHEVISEFEKGYQYKDRVIRHAKVVVSTGQQKKEKSVK
ncbi:MAG: nucleotide exchange factor GrpE [Candidatus Marinimicrobia bacterium]|nr:nucleotide exchange factor GrpE [Candidatus Neomarinimicrobiota bacterium]